LRRGDPNNKGEVATQGFLQVLVRTPEGENIWQTVPPKDSHTSWRRRSLANWLTDTDKGAGHLLARVIVNRLWQHHIGRGIVATPSDFGAAGRTAVPSRTPRLSGLGTDPQRLAAQTHPSLILLSATYASPSQRPIPPSAKPTRKTDSAVFACISVWKRKSCETLSCASRDCSMRRCTAWHAR